MLTIRIDTWTQADCTIGRLMYNGVQCFTLELPWRDNAKGISCIPPGLYTAKRRVSPSKNYEVVQLEGTGERTFIQIHAGNYTRQIKGCILVGDGIKHLDSDGVPDVTNSMNTLNKLLGALPVDQYMSVHITRS